MLFMDMADIAVEPKPYGKLIPKANTMQVQPQFKPPPGNWSG